MSTLTVRPGSQLHSLLTSDPDALAAAVEIAPQFRTKLEARAPHLRGKPAGELARHFTGRAPTGRLQRRTLERKLARTEEKLRQVRRLEGEPIVDRAIAGGRLPAAGRAQALRAYAADPDLFLEVLPDADPSVAAANAAEAFWADPENQRLYEQLQAFRRGA